MKRSTLDQLARDYRLSEPAIALALDLTGSRPDAAAWRAFAIRLLNAAGIAAAGAGAIFFVAANWQHFGAIGRFALLQIAFIACVALAWWRPPPHPLGPAALVLATLLTGGLLALFGQSYQTGADVYELFLAWAALTLPFAFAGASGAVWATWWSVLNVGLALYCGWLGPNHFMWGWLDRWGVGKAMVLLVPCAVNLGGGALFVYLGRTGYADHAPRWLVRMLLTLGFLYGTVACIVAITGGWGRSSEADLLGQNAFVIGAFAAVSIAIAVATLRAKDDVFPMALIIASWIAISTTLLVATLKLRDIGGFFLVAMWLIGTSTGAGFVMMKWVRAWRVGDEDSEVTA